MQQSLALVAVAVWGIIVVVPRTVYDSPANRSRPARLPAVLLGEGVALLLLIKFKIKNTSKIKEFKCV